MTASAQYDLPDWLNPFLVKELRQGLRTNLFVAAFVLVQVAMVTVLGFRMLAMRGDAMSDLIERLDSYLWIAIIVILAVLLPLRGLLAISDEVKGGTIDLVQLTHLSSFSIVMHKWLALVGQTLLLTLTLLPYMVLHYFFGGVDIVSNLVALGWLTLISIMLTAVCLALSSGGLFAKLVVLGVIGFPGYLLSYEFVSHPVNFSSGGPPRLALLWAILVSAAFALALATARISAPGENASTRLRLVALFGMVGAIIGTLLQHANHERISWPMCLVPMMMVAGMEVITERTKDVPSIYTPFVRRGWLGKLAGRVLYPGWSSGVVFVLILTCLFATAVFMGTVRYSSSTMWWSTTVAAWHFGIALLVPGLVLPLLRKVIQRHWAYVLLQGVCLLELITTQIAFTVASRDNLSACVMGSLAPMSAMLWALSHSYGDMLPWAEHFFTSGCSEVLILIILAILSRPENATIRSMEEQALRSILPASNSLTPPLAS